MYSSGMRQYLSQAPLKEKLEAKIVCVLKHCKVILKLLTEGIEKCLLIMATVHQSCLDSC